MEKIPIINYRLDSENSLEVDAIALTGNPAIERTFLAFSKQGNTIKPVKKIKFNSNYRREIIGPAMIPGLLIPRIDEFTGEKYYGSFSAEEIRKASIIFAEKGYQNNINHEHFIMLNGITVFQSYIVDRELGIFPPKGMEDLPDGTWIIGAKVNNDNIWQLVLNGTYAGFSIEGYFDLIETYNSYNIENDTDFMSVKVLEKIRDIYAMISELPS